MVIVKSKITGKFLKRHSGSYRDFRRRIGWKTGDQAVKELGRPCPEGKYNSPEVKAWQEEYFKIQDRLCHEIMFSAIALEARIYANKGSALVSVGVWNRDESGKVERSSGCRRRVNRLPEHLELHERIYCMKEYIEWLRSKGL